MKRFLLGLTTLAVLAFAPNVDVQAGQNNSPGKHTTDGGHAAVTRSETATSPTDAGAIINQGQSAVTITQADGSKTTADAINTTTTFVAIIGNAGEKTINGANAVQINSDAVQTTLTVNRSEVQLATTRDFGSAAITLKVNNQTPLQVAGLVEKNNAGFASNNATPTT